MTQLAVVAVAALALAALLVWDRRRVNPEVVALLSTVDDLCRRIQAPQVAAVEVANAQEPSELLQAVNPEIDDEYWAARMSREELAAALDEGGRG